MRILQIGSSGTDVMERQAMLFKIGYNPGPIDGVFRQQTHQAVVNFQRNFGLIPDGIIGPATLSVMNQFLNGYRLYSIQQGDTFYSISRRFFTQPQLISTANPGVNPDNLRIGQQIVVPYGFNVVDTNIDYTYDIMVRDIDGLMVRYPFLEVGSAGSSTLGRTLYYIRLGRGPNQVFYNGAHHSLEWITSVVLMKFVEDFSRAYALGQNLAGYNPRQIWNSSSIYIVPMVNPDGIDLVLNGLSPDNPEYDNLIQWNNGSMNFSRVWQANNRGVDLNHNYNAAWELSKEAEAEFGITGPGPTRYSGPYPESELETRGMVNFTESHDFRLVLAYHSQGEVIYWTFMGFEPSEARSIGEVFSRITGYALDEPASIASYAGYKDWFIQDFRRPGYTIEVGLGTNPLPISQFDSIYSKNLPLLLEAAII